MSLLTDTESRIYFDKIHINARIREWPGLHSKMATFEVVLERGHGGKEQQAIIYLDGPAFLAVLKQMNDALESTKAEPISY